MTPRSADPPPLWSGPVRRRRVSDRRGINLSEREAFVERRVFFLRLGPRLLTPEWRRCWRGPTPLKKQWKCSADGTVAGRCRSWCGAEWDGVKRGRCRLAWNRNADLRMLKRRHTLKLLLLVYCVWMSHFICLGLYIDCVFFFLQYRPLQFFYFF